MLRSVSTVALLLAACSSPATSAGPEGTRRDPATTASPSDDHGAVSLIYRLVPGTTSTRVIRETSAVKSTVGGNALPDYASDVRIDVTATVLQPRDGAYVVEYRVDDTHADFGEPDSDEDRTLREFMYEIVEEAIGRTHARAITPLGVARATTPRTEGFEDYIPSHAAESLQLLILPDNAVTIGRTWPNCAEDHDPDDSDGEYETTCTVVAIGAGILEIEIEATAIAQSDSEPPRLAGVAKNTIVVTTFTGAGRCAYRVALNDPLPISRDCTAVQRKSGTAGGEPFTWESTNHMIVEVSDAGAD